MNSAALQRFVLAGLLTLLAAAFPQPSAAATVGPSASQNKVPPGWRIFEIPAGGFRVLLPGVPKTSRQSIRTEIGNVASTRYTTTDAANATYDVLINDYPRAGVSRANPEKLLDAARDGLKFQTKGQITIDKRIALADYPGRDLEIRSDDGTHYRARLVWVESRLYQIMVVTPGKPRSDAVVFFDSFQITGKP